MGTGKATGLASWAYNKAGSLGRAAVEDGGTQLAEEGGSQQTI